MPVTARASIVRVPAPKASVVPLAMSIVPLTVPPLPPAMLMPPACTCTLPVLLKVVLANEKSPAPALFLRVPELLKASVPTAP